MDVVIKGHNFLAFSRAHTHARIHDSIVIRYESI